MFCAIILGCHASLVDHCGVRRGPAVHPLVGSEKWVWWDVWRFCSHPAGGFAGHPVGAASGTVGGRGLPGPGPARWGGMPGTGVIYPRGIYVNRYPNHYPYRPGFFPRFPYRYRVRFRFGRPWFFGWGFPFSSGGWYGNPGGMWFGDAASYGNAYSDPPQSSPTYDYSYQQYTQFQQDEIDRLNDAVARLQEQRQAQNREAQYPATQSQPRTNVHGETLLIFQDKHAEEVQNYAIVGKTLWIFTEQRAKKVPIAELDVPATTKANEDRGIDFRLPR